MEGGEEEKPLEELTEQELRQEIVEGINETLGRLALGPVADGTGAFGYGRPERRVPSEKELLPLRCSYVRFTKAFEKDEQIGVRLELLGIFDYGQTYVHLKPQFDKEVARLPQMTDKEKEDFEKFTAEMDAQKEAIEKDGLAPAENRYCFIPLSEVEPPIVSTESFISRAHRVNQQAAEKVLLPEVISTALEQQEAATEPVTGKPKWRVANLQDLRDAAAIVRGYKNFVGEIIQRTPPINWGRPGLTE